MRKGPVRFTLMASFHRSSVCPLETLLEHDPGIVHQDVETTVLIDHRIEEGHDRLLRCHVEVRGRGVTGARRAQISDHHDGAGGGHAVRDGRTDPARPTGDDRHLPVEATAHRATYPPSTGMAVPVMWLLASEARNATSSATSDG